MTYRLPNSRKSNFATEPAGLASCKTGPELGMECLEFIKESLHITNGEIKRRDGELLALRATCW
jgi:hypothetical protein